MIRLVCECAVAAGCAAGGARGGEEASRPRIGWPCVDQSRRSRMRVIITAGCQEMARARRSEARCRLCERDAAGRALVEGSVKTRRRQSFGFAWWGGGGSSACEEEGRASHSGTLGCEVGSAG